jgi:hypothetical protein
MGYLHMNCIVPKNKLKEQTGDKRCRFNNWNLSICGTQNQDKYPIIVGEKVNEKAFPDKWFACFATLISLISTIVI